MKIGGEKMPVKHDKYIDLNQFPHKNGHISWQDSIGKVFYFYFDNEQHTLKIVEKVKSEHFKIIIDNNYIIDSIKGGNLIRLRFSNILNNLNHKYKIGQADNGLTIKGFLGKKYFCKCNLDGYEFDVYDLNKNLIGIFKSPHQITEMFPEKSLSEGSIRNAVSKENYIYKGYYFEPSSYEEYINY